MKRKYDDVFISKFLNDELSSSQKKSFEESMAANPDLTAEVEVLRAILKTAASLESPVVPNQLWSKIESELDAGEYSVEINVWERLRKLEQRLTSWVQIPVPVYRVAGVLALLIVGFIAGRHLSFDGSTEQFSTGQVNADYGIRLVQARTTSYIEKSKILFLGIVNTDPEQFKNIDLTSEKKKAQRLVSEAGFLKDNLRVKKDARLRQLVEQLEMILLEIANLDPQTDQKNIELIRSGIDSQSLLLKITLHDLSEPDVSNQQRENLL